MLYIRYIVHKVGMRCCFFLHVTMHLIRNAYASMPSSAGRRHVLEEFMKKVVQNKELVLDMMTCNPCF